MQHQDALKNDHLGRVNLRGVRSRGYGGVVSKDAAALRAVTSDPAPKIQITMQSPSHSGESVSLCDNGRP